MRLDLFTLAAAAAFFPAFTSTTSAQIRWTGAVGSGIFREVNWDLTASTVTAVDPGVPILDHVEFVGPAPDALIPDLSGQGSFTVGDGFTVLIDGMRVYAGANDGLGSEPGAITGTDVRVINGASFEPFFVVNGVFIDVDATSYVGLGGSGTPLNGSFLNMTFGSRVEFALETPADFRSEHLSKITVDGVHAEEGTNLRIEPLGSQGTALFVIPTTVGTSYCSANPHGSGATARMGAFGSPSVAADSLALECTSMPPLVFGFFIVSTDEGFVANPGGSAGNLCLSGAVGRFVGAGEIQNSGLAGRIELDLDLQTGLPQPNGFVMPTAGEVWRFQCWFRDSSAGGAPTSNFSDGLAITFV